MKIRTTKQLEADPRVDQVWREMDGYGDTEEEANRPSIWISLAQGWTSRRGTHSIHEKTVRACAEELRDVVRCDSKNSLCDCRF